MLPVSVEVSQLPVDVRVAEFLAELDDCSSSDAASLKKGQVHTAAGSQVHVNQRPRTTGGPHLVSETSGGWSWEFRKEGPSDARRLRGTPFGKAVEGLNLQGTPDKAASKDYTTACNASTPAVGRDVAIRKLPRRRRYRNQQQKLSNSLAQKRYRERKKQAFERMQGVVGQLSSEVKSLRGVRKENERLVRLVAGFGYGVEHLDCQPQSLEGRQCIAVPCASTQYVLPNRSQSGGAFPVSTSMPDDWTIPSQNWENSQAASEEYEAIDVTEGKTSITVPENVVFADAALAGSTSRDSIVKLEEEWNRSLVSLDKVINHGMFQQGTANQHEQELLEAVVNTLFSTSSRMVDAKIQRVVEEHHSNCQRINEIFQAVSGCQSGCSN
ncbi:hypothetical protein BSKO_08494 [Bryopsis sp. KO-2023]|nr:hypothetical protein BSKO_08494 [Bryopsis sp. KO-2023]